MVSQRMPYRFEESFVLMGVGVIGVGAGAAYRQKAVC